MTVAFNLLLHLLLIASLLLFLGALILVNFAETDNLERLIRAAAFFCGSLVVIGAQAAGANYAEFIVRSFATVRPVSFGFFGALFPAAAGSGVGWYFTRTIRRSSTLGIRLLGFVGMLAATQFVQVYAAATQRNGLALRASAVPNIAFLVGLILWVVLKWEPGAAPAAGPAASGIVSRFQKMTSSARSRRRGA